MSEPSSRETLQATYSQLDLDVVVAESCLQSLRKLLDLEIASQDLEIASQDLEIALEAISRSQKQSRGLRKAVEVVKDV